MLVPLGDQVVWRRLISLKPDCGIIIHDMDYGSVTLDGSNDRRPLTVPLD
jgi:hypothetical protein